MIFFRKQRQAYELDDKTTKWPKEPQSLLVNWSVAEISEVEVLRMALSQVITWVGSQTHLASLEESLISANLHILTN